VASRARISSVALPVIVLQNTATFYGSTGFEHC
jgi:hypothetical protein